MAEQIGDGEPSLSDLPSKTWAWGSSVGNIATGVAPMPAGRYRHLAVEDGGKVYVIGGWDSTDSPIDTVFEYDTRTDSWSTKSSFPETIASVSGAAIDGTIYVTGGWNGTATIDTVREYDIETDTWSTGTAMPEARSNSLGAAVDGKLYVIGGYNGSSAVQDTVLEYDPGTDTWTTKTAMPSGRINLPRSGPVVGGVIYAPGGNNGTSGTNTLYAYDVSADSWSTKSTLPFASEEIAAAGVDGAVYIHDRLNASSFYEYDPVADDYTAHDFTWIWNDQVRYAEAVASGGLFYLFSGDTNNDPTRNCNAFKP